ncbi:MAG: DUF3768 domain-containing protein [Pseudomonadota bacterium]
MTASEKKTCAQLPRAERIAQLNDKLRFQGLGGATIVTRAVVHLDGFCPRELAAALAGYCGFDPDNDPHGERDFGDLELFGAELLWKIDYYDPDYRFGSNDPADAAQTKRILTVMLASEY